MRAQTSIMPQRQNFAQSKVRFTEGISLVKRPTRNRFDPIHTRTGWKFLSQRARLSSGGHFESKCCLEELPGKSFPLTESVNAFGGTVAKPTIKLRLLFELLAAQKIGDHKVTCHFGECGHVAPQLFELSDREDILLTMSPTFFYILECNVGG